MLAIRTLQKSGTPAAESVDQFIDAHDFPLREGTTTTFVYRGDARAVRLHHWIYGLPSSQPFERVEGTDLWHLVMEIPEHSRVEYKFEVVREDGSDLIRDPLNPHLAHDPYGANSVCHGRGYTVPDWTQPDPEAREGTIHRLEVKSAVFGETRPALVYVPPRMRRTRRYPLLIVHDGPDYVRYAGLRTVLDNLIYRMEIPQLIVALTESPHRLTEYAADPRHGTHIVDELLPALDAEFPLLPEAGARGLMGASFGAVATLSTAWRAPGRFGRLLLQSGSFAFSDLGERHDRGEVFDPVVPFMNAFRDDPGQFSSRLFVSCGIYESLIYENRSLVPILQSSGMDVRYVEARDGHNWENWRDRLREGLAWLFPGPLWMVYE